MENYRKVYLESLRAMVAATSDVLREMESGIEPYSYPQDLPDFEELHLMLADWLHSELRLKSSTRRVEVFWKKGKASIRECKLHDK
jgi:hypothetical protein